MKKFFIISLTFVIILILNACSNSSIKKNIDKTNVSSNNSEQQTNNSNTKSDTQTQKTPTAELTVEYLKSLPETPSKDFEYGRSLSGVGYAIVEYIGSSDVVIIPSEIDGHPVDELAKGVFDHHSSVRGVVIPKTIKETQEVFVNCKSIELVVAEGLETVGYGTFTNSSIKQIKLGDNLQKIDVTAFGLCNNLESLNIPSTFKGLSAKDLKIAFMNCSNLTIYGKSGSYIEKIAKESSIPFVAE